jgi:hypothetical protein
MSSIRFSFMLLAAVQALSACANHPDATAPTGPAVAMPQLDAAIANSTPEEARRAISNKTWLWTRGGGPYQVHYSTADGRDFAWLVGESRILRGEWRIDTTTGAQGQPLVQLCLRYPGVRRQDLSDSWSCRPAGTFFVEMADRESGDPLHLLNRIQAQFVLATPPASLAEVEAQVVGR